MKSRESQTGEEIRENREPEKPQKHQKNFYPTQRDLRAIRWICEQGIATVDQVWMAIYKGEGSRSSKYAEERLRGLCKQGCLKRVRVFGSGATNYIGTIRGMNRLADLRDAQNRMYLPALPRRVNPVLYRHRMGLNLCRVFIETISRVDFWVNDRSLVSYAEDHFLSNQLRYLKSVLPDAYFQFQKSRWFLEYELTQKNKKKYQEKNTKYSSIDLYGIRGIIFIVETRAMERVLKSNYSGFTYEVFTLKELESGKVQKYLEHISEQDYQMTQQRRRNASSELDECVRQSLEIEEELKEVKEQLRLKQERVEQVKREKIAYSKRLIRFESTQKELKADLDRLERDISRLSGSVSELEEIKKSLKVRIERLKNGL